MNKIKKLLKKVWDGIKKFYESLTHNSKKWVSIAIDIVEALKVVVDSPVDDIILEIIKKAIPGTADDIVIDRVKKVVEVWLPRVLLELQLLESISKLENDTEKLKAVLGRIKDSSEETKAVVYHGLASLFLEKLSDGEITWSDSVALTEYYFNCVKGKQV